MTNLEDVFIADQVTHAYNLHPSNYAIQEYAETVIDFDAEVGELDARWVLENPGVVSN